MKEKLKEIEKKQTLGKESDQRADHRSLAYLMKMRDSSRRTECFPLFMFIRAVSSYELLQ